MSDQCLTAVTAVFSKHWNFNIKSTDARYGYNPKIKVLRFFWK